MRYGEVWRDEDGEVVMLVKALPVGPDDKSEQWDVVVLGEPVFAEPGDLTQREMVRHSPYSPQWEKVE